MDDLESQIAKISLGNSKNSGSYVHIMAETAAASSAELYMVAELPMLNPAAEESCERICLGIGATLKRAYSRPGASFETAISLINEELGKLASMGQTEWVAKLNCILGVKDGHDFNIATTGKVSAYLLRAGEYTDISCSPDQVHPLKTFENFATGKIRLDDLLILSTTQLFNYLSMDRLLQVMGVGSFLAATQTIIQLLKENSGSDVSFGVLLNLQVPAGQTEEAAGGLENYVVETQNSQPSILSKGLNYIKTAFAFGKDFARSPKTDLPKISLGQGLKNLSGNTKNFVAKGRGFWQRAKNSASSVTTTVRAQNIKDMGPVKKFFLASALFLFIVLIANIFLAVHLKKTRQEQSQMAGRLQSVQNLLQNAQSLLLYKDSSQASSLLQQAQSQMPTAKEVPSSEKADYQKLVTQLSNIQSQTQKVSQAQVTNLGSLGAGSTLIALPNIVATQSKNLSIISYNEQNGAVDDSALKSAVNIVDDVYTSGTSAVVYDGSSLYLWNFSTGKLSPGFNLDVPAQANFGGMAYYSTNSRVYLADKQSAQVFSFLVGKNGFSRPLVSLHDAGLNQSQSLSIDGSIYYLTTSGLNKFLADQQANFSLPLLVPPFSGNGKIYTTKTFSNIYLLDEADNRIVVMDKSGNLIDTLKSNQFSKLMDFSVDEKNKAIFVLNDGSLLKVTLP